MTWRPTANQAKLLRYIQLQSSVSASEVARSCSMPRHAVLYALKRFRAEGLLVSRPLINFSRLGLTEYHFLLRVAEGARHARSALIGWASTTDNVLVLFELGGDYQYEVVITAPCPAALAAAERSLSAALGDVLIEKTMTVRLSTWFFGTKLLGTFRKPLPVIGYRWSTKTEEVSDLDFRLLGALERMNELNVSGLARQLGQANSTIEYRLHRLMEKQVIVAYYYDYTALNESLAYLGFHLLIRLKAVDERFDARFFQFCRAHPYVDLMQEGVGNWERKIIARVPGQGVALRLVDEVQEHFGKAIGDIRLLPQLTHRRMHVFPDPSAPDECRRAAVGA